MAPVKIVARLRRPAEFQAVFDSGRRVPLRHFTAVVAANPLTHPRLGFALSKKVAARAVDRNRIKRQWRECFRQAIAALPPVDIVLLGRGSCAKATNADLRLNAQELWKKIAA